MKSTANRPKIALITGQRGIGKTTKLLEMVDFLTSKEVDLCGVATPKIVKDGQVTGIEVVDLRTGHKKVLAVLDSLSNIRIGPWHFLQEAIDFANSSCDPAKCEGVAIIDEIGPLEFSGGGFSVAFDALTKGNYDRAIVVIRPELIEKAKSRFEGNIKLFNDLKTLIPEVSDFLDI